MKEKILEIIDESSCNEEVIATVEELYGDEGINMLYDLDFDMSSF